MAIPRCLAYNFSFFSTCLFFFFFFSVNCPWFGASENIKSHTECSIVRGINSRDITANVRHVVMSVMDIGVLPKNVSNALAQREAYFRAKCGIFITTLICVICWSPALVNSGKTRREEKLTRAQSTTLISYRHVLKMSWVNNITYPRDSRWVYMLRFFRILQLLWQHKAIPLPGRLWSYVKVMPPRYFIMIGWQTSND